VAIIKSVKDAIELKIASQQAAEQMEFVLAKEKKEAERKAVEAEGIRNFQQIVTQGITPSLLTWKRIEATEKLAMSNNTKMVIIGGKDGLPIILNAAGQ
jgi:regulator of protease activity HflC (stomatin/prohibitin superfamily)